MEKILLKKGASLEGVRAIYRNGKTIYSSQLTKINVQSNPVSHKDEKLTAIKRHP